MLYYCTTIPLFTITKPTPASFSSPLMTTTHPFHCTHPTGHQISITLQLPYNSYNCKYQTFQYVQLWQELQSATTYLDPPLPDDILANLSSQMLGNFRNKWLAIRQANNPTEPLWNFVQFFSSFNTNRYHPQPHPRRWLPCPLPSRRPTSTTTHATLQLPLTIPTCPIPPPSPQTMVGTTHHHCSSMHYLPPLLPPPQGPNVLQSS